MPLRRENQRMITSFMKELSEPAVDSKSIPRKKTAGSVGSFMSYELSLDGVVSGSTMNAAVRKRRRKPLQHS